MSRQAINVVWLKRDLRTKDHLPLAVAQSNELPYLLVFIWDHDQIRYTDTADRHLWFQYQSILVMDEQLKPYAQKVIQFYGSSVDVFSYLIDQYHIQKVFFLVRKIFFNGFAQAVLVQNICTIHAV